MPVTLPAGVILAGGRSRRMPDRPKALLPLDDEPMISRVIRRLQPQVQFLWISVAGNAAVYERFGLPVITDIRPGHQGPLTGLYSAMQTLQQHGGSEWLLICPCDAPLLPRDLGEQLLDSARSAGSQVSVVRYQKQMQPTFSLWHLDVLPRLKEAVVEKKFGGFKQILHSLSYVTLEWKWAEVTPFFNVNNPADLRHAKNLLDRETRSEG